MQGEELPIGLRCGTAILSLADIELAGNVLLLASSCIALEFGGNVSLLCNWRLFILAVSFQLVEIKQDLIPILHRPAYNIISLTTVKMRVVGRINGMYATVCLISALV